VAVEVRAAQAAEDQHLVGDVEGAVGVEVAVSYSEGNRRPHRLAAQFNSQERPRSVLNNVPAQINN
jgi:hypothetical protein